MYTHFSLGDPRPSSQRAATWTVCLGKAAPGRKPVFPEAVLPFLEDSIVRWGGRQAPSPQQKSQLELAWRRMTEMRAKHWALPSPARYLTWGNTSLINWKIKVIVKTNYKSKTLVNTYWILLSWAFQPSNIILNQTLFHFMTRFWDKIRFS